MNIKQLIAEVEGSRVVIRPGIRSKPFSPTKSFPLDLNPEDEEIYGDQHLDGWIGVDTDGDGVIDLYIPDPKMDIPDEDDDIPDIEGGEDIWNMPEMYQDLFTGVTWNIIGDDDLADHWFMEGGHFFVDDNGDGQPDRLHIGADLFLDADGNMDFELWEDWIIDNLYDLESWQAANPNTVIPQGS